MKYMRRYLDYLEKYLNYEKTKVEESRDAKWIARHDCSCKVKDVMKKKFDEIHQAFKPADSKALRLLAGPKILRCDDDWPSCAPEKRFLPIMKKK